ncbi:RNA 2',3'-cyclic phosphodiesterase [Cupriavidus basilensis]|uniref:RNA 2',3'-cyclic phosphodiesterase n=1 Tax=Cupriavidus basilensis TaxID=68895 RepID=UPI0023E75E4C|nr:RNA 2',3'-cyclic phosphodiesterase [Cupriavidus basilensis]MDF3884934.1 RNA 2',3'-cyclic phosphodiesterase [Cupriavidus basilensis]
MARLFVAIEIPQALASALLARVPRVAGIRPATLDQIHLTLHFLGEQDEAAAMRIEQALGTVSCAAFALTVKEAGYFRGRRASVLWAGLESNAALDDLYAGVERALAGNGIGMGIGHDEDNALPDSGSRPQARFHPHITLARCAPAVAHTTLQAWRGSQSGLVCEPFHVDRFILYQSHLLPGGAQHVCRRAYALNASEDPPAG